MTQFTHSSFGKKQRRRGVELVEFALVLPIMLVLLLAVMEAGWLVKSQLTISNAAREGVRYAALNNTSTAVKTRIKGISGTLNPALTDAQITLDQTADKTSATPVYTAWPADTTATSTVPSRNGVPVGNIIRITIVYAHQPLTGFFPFLRNRNVTVAASMAREAN